MAALFLSKDLPDIEVSSLKIAYKKKLLIFSLSGKEYFKLESADTEPCVCRAVEFNQRE